MKCKSIAWLAAVAFALVAGDLGAQDPNYNLTVEPVLAAPGSSFSTTVTLDLANVLVQGWSYGVCTEPADITPLTIANGATTATVNGGAAPGFVSNTAYPGGWTTGIVINLFGANPLNPGTGYELSVLTGDNLMPLGGTSDLCFCNSLGTPAVATVFVTNGASITPVTSCGTLESFVPPTVDHIRGDANQDALINIADGVWMLNSLFQGGPSFDCLGANDANGDGAHDASDGVYIFNYQFLDGPQPPAPFPSCGGDADPDPADCASYSACP